MRVFVLCFLGVVLMASSVPETRKIMHRIYSPISELLPLSMDEKAFRAKGNRKKILGKMDELVTSASLLRDHVDKQRQSLQFMGRSFERDVQDMRRWYSMGRYEEAMFIIHNLTETCISCHSKAKSQANFPLAQKLAKSVNAKNISLYDRAKLLVATRQFDAAMKAYETLFASTDYSPAQMALMSAFTDYLKLAIRVQGNTQRPQIVLKKWLKRPQVPLYMNKRVNKWLLALAKLDAKKLNAASGLGYAKKLIHSAGETDDRFSQERLVQFIAASAVLHDIVDTPKNPAKVFGEAYYLLGVCESVIGQSFWVSETEFFLEAAIRKAPKSAVAKKAYLQLEEYISAEFTGSAGTMIPESIAAHLKELRILAGF